VVNSHAYALLLSTYRRPGIRRNVSKNTLRMLLPACNFLKSNSVMRLATAIAFQNAVACMQLFEKQ
jgi:hypothetical protein